MVGIRSGLQSSMTRPSRSTSSLGIGAGEERVANQSKFVCVVHTVSGLVCLEPGREFVGLIENLLCGSRHGRHLRYLDRAGMT